MRRCFVIYNLELLEEMQLDLGEQMHVYHFLLMPIKKSWTDYILTLNISFGCVIASKKLKEYNEMFFPQQNQNFHNLISLYILH